MGGGKDWEKWNSGKEKVRQPVMAVMCDFNPSRALVWLQPEKRISPRGCSWVLHT